MNFNSPASVAARAAAAPVAALKFTGENADFRQLVTTGAALELVTLGFYRFWLATRIRAHLWSHTEVDGDALEYLGTARELLIGFLVAVAILAPAYLAYFLVGVVAESYQSLASLPLAVCYYGFLQFAIYRGRRYRLNRTMWRGVRFDMDGSGAAYALKAMGWTVAVFLTLGLLYPWRQAALERAKMRHTFYGGLRGDFAGTGAGLFRGSLVALCGGRRRWRQPRRAGVSGLAEGFPMAPSSCWRCASFWRFRSVSPRSAPAMEMVGRRPAVRSRFRIVAHQSRRPGRFLLVDPRPAADDGAFLRRDPDRPCRARLRPGLRIAEKGGAPTIVMLVPMAILYLGFC